MLAFLLLQPERLFALSGTLGRTRGGGHDGGQTVIVVVVAEVVSEVATTLDFPEKVEEKKEVNYVIS